MLAALAPTARAGDTVSLAARAEVDPTRPPWNAVAKVQTNIGTRCTGVLVAPATVLTAAHCLYNPRTRALLQPGSVHVLFGFRRGAFLWHGLVADYAIPPGFDPSLRRPQSADLARLRLAAPLPAGIAPLPVSAATPVIGMPLALAGYNQDRNQLLMADAKCRVLGVGARPNGTFLLHDCAATHGTSGGPLLTRDGDRWAVLGINLGIGRRGNIGLAVAEE